MAKAKSKTTKEETPSTAPKIVDVTSDSSVGASSSSRPLIVSSRPIVHDPMMVEDISTMEPSTAPSLNKSAPLNIPIPGEIPEQASSSRAVHSDPMMVGSPQVARKKLIPPSERNSANVTPPSDDTSKKSSAKIDIVGVTTHDSIPTETDKSKSGSDGNDGSGTDIPDDSAEAEATAAADNKAKIDKLVEDHAYTLPINAVQRRRAQRVAVLGLLVIILLAFAWLDLASDVGLIKVPHLPLTHFFSR